MGIKMKTLVIKYWWTLIAFMAFVMIILLILVMSAPATVFETILGILLLMTLIALPVSWIVLLINKQWRKCLLSFILSIVTIFVLGGMLSFAAMWGPGYDNFGKKHPIPDGLKYNIPMDRDSIAITPVDSLDADAFLQVRGHYGEYSYDLFYGPLPAGEVFLRCYEATKNIPLSEDRLTERSKVAIDSTITLQNKTPALVVGVSVLSIIRVVQGEGHDEAAALAVIRVQFEASAEQEDVAFGEGKSHAQAF